jgi:hypothetical protein
VNSSTTFTTYVGNPPTPQTIQYSAVQVGSDAELSCVVQADRSCATSHVSLGG